MVTVCPICGSNRLTRQWCVGRTLSQKCYDCDWIGEPKIPEDIPIITTKKVLTGQFDGFHYEVFDKYGYILTCSRTYVSKDEAMDNMRKELKLGKKDLDAGPYTAVFWPPSVLVRGKIFK